MNQKAGWYSCVHPAFRILCFVILSLFVSLGSGLQFGLAAAVVLVLYFTTSGGLWAGLWLMLRRMRWFLLSIFVIYAWLTPGGDGSAWLPTMAGAINGAERMLALVCIIAAVHWLLFVTPREQLVAALYWLMAPLQLVGVSRQRFAVRVALILDRVVEVQMLVSQRVNHADVSKGDLNGYAAAASGLVEEVVTQGEQEECLALEIDIADVPPARQWGWPVLMLSVMLLVA